MAYRDFGYTVVRDRYHAVTQPYNFGAESNKKKLSPLNQEACYIQE